MRASVPVQAAASCVPRLDVPRSLSWQGCEAGAVSVPDMRECCAGSMLRRAGLQLELHRSRASAQGLPMPGVLDPGVLDPMDARLAAAALRSGHPALNGGGPRLSLGPAADLAYREAPPFLGAPPPSSWRLHGGPVDVGLPLRDAGAGFPIGAHGRVSAMSEPAQCYDPGDAVYAPG
jgi:hypothetical protein